MDPRLSELTVEGLLERLSTADPIPGGGSASALAGAMGAALVRMVIALSVGRPASADHAEELATLAGSAATLTSELLRLSELDAAAYAAVVAARRLPRETEIERLARTRQVEASTREATMVPLEVARRSQEVLGLAERLAPIGNRHAVSDVGVAALLATAGLRGAAMNVRINLPYLPASDTLRTDAEAELDRLLDDIDHREQAVREAVAERMG